MKIAIHPSRNSFSERWIAYCERKGIPYKLVNAYDTDIVAQLADCDCFLWHHHHANYRDALFARQLLYSLQMAGKRVFPDFRTGWHFDDKVGQKYMFEALGLPLVPSYVFYDKSSALRWIARTDFPKVFKLRGGAGASNVRLVHTKSQARRLVRRSFGRGFVSYNRWEMFGDSCKKFLQRKGSFFNVCKSLIRLFVGTTFSKMHGTERGYAYFQDFIPNNDYDIRVVVTGNKAFAIKRNVRKGDFRASGSGDIEYDRTTIDERCVKLAFEANLLIQSQSAAFDFVFNDNVQPLIVEISYGYTAKGYDKCPGYWTDDMIWHQESFVPQEWIIDNLIK